MQKRLSIRHLAWRGGVAAVSNAMMLTGLYPFLPHALRAVKTRAPNDDPRLLAAAIVLDSAHAELQQAIAQHPDSPFLADLLNRTQARRDKLDHFGASAG